MTESEPLVDINPAAKYDVGELPELDEQRQLDLAAAAKNRGNDLYRSGDYRAAVREYTVAIESCPNEASFLGNRSAAYMMMEQFDKSIEDSIVAIRIDPNFVKAYIRASKCYCQMGQLADASNLLSNCPPRVAASFDIQNERARVHQLSVQLADCAASVEAGRAASAMARIQVLIHDMSRSLQCRTLMVEGYIARKKYQDALSLCTRLIQDYASNTTVLRLRGLTYYYQGQLDKALYHFQEALKFDPDDKKCFAMFKKVKLMERLKSAGNESFKAGRMMEAYGSYTEALEVDPLADQFNKVLLCNRAAVSLKKGRFEETVQDCTRCLEIDQEYIKALCRRSSAYLSLKQFDEAVRDLETASQFEPSRDIKDQLRAAQLELAKSKRKDYYAILGVSQDAEERDLKRAYRRLALQYHPDKNSASSPEEKSHAEAKFKDINEAYDTLSDPEKRRRHDSGADLNIGGGCGGHGHGGVDVNDVFQMFFNQSGGGAQHGFQF